VRAGRLTPPRAAVVPGGLLCSLGLVGRRRPDEADDLADDRDVGDRGSLAVGGEVPPAAKQPHLGLPGALAWLGARRAQRLPPDENRQGNRAELTLGRDGRRLASGQSMFGTLRVTRWSAQPCRPVKVVVTVQVPAVVTVAL